MIFQTLEEEVKQLSLENTRRDWGQSIILSKTHDKDNNVIGRQKLLIFKPGASILMEKHLNYSELWIGDSEFEYILENEIGEFNRKVALPYERVFIPKNKRHKIISGGTGLRIFEVQMGIIENSDKIQYDHPHGESNG